MIDGEGYPLRYAFGFDNTLFISLDVTRSGALSDEQMAWLDTLLQQQGSQYRYRVLFSHLPMWAFAVGREHDIIADPALEALLKRHAIDLYLSGHHHAYFPGFKDGIAYVGQACLGGGARRLIGSKHRAARSFTWLDLGPDQASVSAYMAPEFNTAVNLHKLPGSLNYRGATLLRLDLAPPGHRRVVPATESTAHGS